MKFTTTELRHIAAHASTLRERLDGRVVVRSSSKIDERLDRWCAFAAGGDRARFMKRLAWDGISLERAQAALGDVSWPEHEPLPSWTATLAGAFDTSFTVFEGCGLPFEEAVAPIASRVAAGIEAPGFERELLSTLSHVLMIPLYEVFAERRSEKMPLSRLPGMTAPLADRRELYLEFVHELWNGGWTALFTEYPVAARLVGTIIELKLAAYRELLGRIDVDRALLAETFGASGEITAIDTKLSDPHRGGRSVALVTFSSGTSVIYKPRSTALEVVFTELSQKLGGPKPYRVVDRGEYGWAEKIEYAPCSDLDAARRFYERTGMLVALAYALKGTDCHLENLIACGEHPVLVDAETFAYPSIIGDPRAHSVLTTGFLPVWERSPEGRDFDLGGLGGDPTRPVDLSPFEHVNTDGMKARGTPRKTKQTLNRPYLAEGGFLSPADFTEEIVRGFRKMFSRVLEHREDLLNLPLPERLPVRFLLRDTELYGRILAQSLSADVLRSGVERSLVLELLARAHLVESERPKLWSVLTDEQDAVLQLDIPIFFANVDDDGLTGLVPHVFTGTPRETLRAHVAGLGPRDLEREVNLVCGALDAFAAVNGESRIKAEETEEVAETSTELEVAAQAIADRFELLASRDASGVNWLSLASISAEHYQLQLMAPSFYEGLAGVMLFLAAAKRRSLALEAAAALRNVPIIGLGAGTGAGGVIYALVQTAKLIDAPELLADAARIAASIDDRAVEEDQTLDLVGGSAGAILGLLALDRATGDRIARAKAIACGDKLVASAIQVGPGRSGWITVSERMLTGFSHGASGIAYALAKLGDRIGEPKYLRGAIEGFAFEHALFSPAAKNWPDLRFETEGFGGSWCHGAPGIGLALLAARHHVAHAEDLEHAIATTAELGGRGVDHLCCGVLGRTELLLEAGRVLDRPELIARSRQLATTLIARAEKGGGYKLFGNLPRRATNLGFFQGLAGIGYQLLRTADPEALPSALAFAQ